MTDRNTIELGDEKFLENVYTINDTIKPYAFIGTILRNIIIIINMKKKVSPYMENHDIYTQTSERLVPKIGFLNVLFVTGMYLPSTNTIVYY